MLVLVLVILCVEAHISGSDASIKGSMNRQSDLKSTDDYNQEEKNQYIKELIKKCDKLKLENNIDEYNRQNCDELSQNITSFSESLDSDIQDSPITLSINKSKQTILQMLTGETEKIEKPKMSLLNQKTKAKIRVCLNQRIKEEKMKNGLAYDTYIPDDGNDQLISNNDVIGISRYIYIYRWINR
jgi:predicted DNA binding CopG/RHH family protein